MQIKWPDLCNALRMIHICSKDLVNGRRIINKMERQPTEWKKAFANHMSERS